MDGLEHPITNTDHPGYYAEDYRAKEGTELYAPLIGGNEVEWIVRIGKHETKGQIITLNHNGVDEYKIVLGHLSEYKVEDKQRVKSGDLIALSGGSVDADYPVGVSTGSHLHCEYIKNKVWVKDYTGGGYTSPEIASYLQEKACNDLKDKAQLLIDLGNEYRIKPEVVVAIMQADTSLGKDMATPNNPGNVGNTDGGGRWTPDTMEEGVEAMFRALNNNSLGSLTMIGELSGDGRVALGLSGCANNCYATSLGGYWNGNVLSVLRKLHDDTTINEYFNFRF